MSSHPDEPKNEVVRSLLSLALRSAVGERLRVGRGRLLDYVRSVLVDHGDPLVDYRLDGIDIELPLSHELPRYRSVYPGYGANLGRLARAVADAHSGCGVVDIGANVGDSAACVRAACAAPVLCIEGDPRFFEILSRNARRIPGLTLDRALVGAESTTIRGELGAARGTARVGPGGCALRFERLDVILARHPDFPTPKLVKTDTDGCDLPILAGHLELWQELRPVLFFEYDPAFVSPDFDPAAFFAAFAERGYERLLVWENVGDYLCSFSLADRASLLDLHARYVGWNSHRYADVALFHADDGELAEHVRRGENSHAERQRAAPDR